MRTPIFALCILVLGACAAPVDEAPQRAPIGKADSIGSCDSACDGPAPVGNCWCDSECSEIGDCCEDLAEFCPELAPPAATCFSSTDCDEESHCSTEDGVCNSSCPAGLACPQVCSGTCVADEPTDACGFDTDGSSLGCTEGEVCSTGICLFSCHVDDPGCCEPNTCVPAEPAACAALDEAECVEREDCGTLIVPACPLCAGGQLACVPMPKVFP